VHPRKLDQTLEINVWEFLPYNLENSLAVLFPNPPAGLQGTAPTLQDKPSIVVLPFQNMSGDAEQEYFCDGLVEDINTTLSKLAGLRVIARNSTFVYRGRSVDVRDAAKQLGVRYVLEGSEREIMAITGHRSVSEVSRYTKAVEQAKLAE
jgi:hypothetical protein